MWDIVITVMVLFLIILIWVMLYDSNRFVIVKHTFSDKRIQKKCRAVVLSDLHNKCYGKKNEHLISAIREAKPDFILTAGDMITAKPGESLEIPEYLLKELAKDYPIYYANGNHEHRLKLYPEVYKDMGEKLGKILKKYGIHLLVNEHTFLSQYGICIYGSEIDRFYYKRFHVQHMESSYMKEILGQPKEQYYNILLAHNPDYFPQYAKWGADLVFSGHVHGGMVRIPFLGKGVVSPRINFFPKYDGGLFKQGKSTMILSRGLGMHSIPIRLFNPGEVLVIDFDTADSIENGTNHSL